MESLLPVGLGSRSRQTPNRIYESFDFEMADMELQELQPNIKDTRPAAYDIWESL